MNDKLQVLYQERKWLRQIADEIGKVDILAVKRLDETSVTRQLGEHLYTVENRYILRGYFFDEHGYIVAPIGPQPHVSTHYLGRFVRLISDYVAVGKSRGCTTIEDEMRLTPERNRIRYVVVFGRDPWSTTAHWAVRGAQQLTLYKMPNGILADDFLQSIDDARIAQAEANRRAASQELRKELSEVD